MATERYDAKQEFIAKSAFRLFRSNGFFATSIKDIADASGIKKAAVRYYFPQKSTFEDMFLRKSLSIASGFLRELEIENLDPYCEMLLLGYFELYYVTMHKEMAALGIDLMSSRDITTAVVSTLTDWVRDNVPQTNEDFTKLHKAMVFVIGGAFETIYADITNEVPVDLPAIFRTSNMVLDQLFDGKLPLPDAPSLMSNEWLEEKSCEMDRELFG